MGNSSPGEAGRSGQADPPSSTITETRPWRLARRYRSIGQHARRELEQLGADSGKPRSLLGRLSRLVRTSLGKSTPRPSRAYMISRSRWKARGGLKWRRSSPHKALKRRREVLGSPYHPDILSTMDHLIALLKEKKGEDADELRIEGNGLTTR